MLQTMAQSARRTEFTDEELLGLDEEVDAQTVSTAADNFDFNVRSKYRSGFWLGLLLLVLAIGDAVALRYTGQSLVQITHVLAFLL